MQPNVLRSTACTRRKPSKTYKSPTATEWTTYAPCPSLHPKSTSSTPTPPPSRVNATTRPAKQLPSRSRQFTLQLLPLYHPHGQLACSLPPLDPLSFGLEAPIILNEPEASRSSSRARRRSPQVRAAAAADVQAPPAPVAISTVSAVAAVAAREIKEKEKPSPRKRRIGGGGGKRKRKDNDSDATYPAKRTRAPRNTTMPQVIEEEPPNEMEANGPEDQDELDAENETLVERRTTRSRAGLQRQSSVNTTSDMPSKSVSPGVPNAPADPTVHHDTEMKTPTPESDHVGTPANQGSPPVVASMKEVQVEEKEEGELSDDGH